MTLFAADRGHLPADLAEVFAHRLPAGRSNDPATDLYERRLLYRPATDGTFTVESLGADGKRGGKGSDADAKADGP